MSNFGQTLIEPALPITIEVPDFANLADAQFIVYAASVSDLYLQSENRKDLREQIKLSCINRMRKLVLGATDEEVKNSLRVNIHNIYCLMEVYVYAVGGAPLEGGFAAPRHLWSNELLEEQILTFLMQDELTHTYQRTNSTLDFMWLYKERISERN